MRFILLTIFIGLVHGKVLDNSGTSCDVHRMRVCMKQFMTHVFLPDQICPAVQTNIDCHKLAGCCHEYMNSQCLNVVDKVADYRDRYLTFEGCPFMICDCGCQSSECQSKMKRGSFSKNHYSTTSGLMATVFLVLFFAILVALL